MSFVQDITLEGKVPLTKLEKEESRKKLEEEYKKVSKLVKGVFKNLEAPGGTLEFTLRLYPQDPVRKYTFEDGGEYEIPLYVAKHINKTCNEKQHQHVVDKNGKKTVDVTKGKQRYEFLSTEFM